MAGLCAPYVQMERGWRPAVFMDKYVPVDKTMGYE